MIGFRKHVRSSCLVLCAAMLDPLLVVLEVASLGMQVEWKTYAYDEPADLPERLIAAGFVPDERETLIVGEAATLRGISVRRLALAAFAVTGVLSGLMGAFIIGLATTRYVLTNPAVADLSHDEVIRWAGPVIKHLLVGPAPGADG